MKTYRYLLFLFLGLFFTINISAQTITEGTIVSLKSEQVITTSKKMSKKWGLKKPEVGDLVKLSVTEDVYDENDNLIIPAGTPAVGKVSYFKKRSLMGKGAELSVQADYIQLENGKNIKLKEGDLSVAGNSAKTGKIFFWCFIYAFPINYIFPAMMKGDHAMITEENIFNAVVAETTE